MAESLYHEEKMFCSTRGDFEKKPRKRSLTESSAPNTPSSKNEEGDTTGNGAALRVPQSIALETSGESSKGGAALNLTRRRK